MEASHVFLRQSNEVIACEGDVHYLADADLFVLNLTMSFNGVMGQTGTVLVNVGVVLDMDTWMGKIGLRFISIALLDFYSSHGSYKTRLVLNTRDSKNDVVGAAAAALDLFKNVEVLAIIGPQTSTQAHFVSALGEKAHVPIISFSATSPSLSPIQSTYFTRATPSDSSQVKAITAIVQAFGWREVVPIYIDNDFGRGIIPYLIDALQEIHTRVTYKSAIPPLATDEQIVAELQKFMTMQTRVFIVHMLPSLGSRFFTKAKEIGVLSEGYVWIITNGLTNDLSSLDPLVIDSMQGVIGVKPYVPQTEELKKFSIRWKRTFQLENSVVPMVELNVYGLWAYDATKALAIAIEKVGATDTSFDKANAVGNLTDLEAFGVSKHGLKLIHALRSTTFKGLSGPFKIVDGQLQSLVYQIVNVIGKGERVVGYWTEEKGILRELNSKNTNTDSIVNANFKAIIWPGDIASPPKGWAIPTNDIKLRIGVPVKDRFQEFVMVSQDPSTNKSTVSGYCIEVFEAVMAALPYHIPYEYIPFANPDGKMAGTYNDLVYQVYLGKYDAVAGDVTIIANRSQYVDFTLPYTESGISMIVPIKDKKNKDPWVFFKPFTWKLWVTIFCSFVFIGFVIWVLEHPINEDFRGQSSHRIGMMFWFSFSTMLSIEEHVLSNLSRFVVIIWMIVLIILNQGYTASLTTRLTVQQLQPTIIDAKELLRKGEYVGYHNGSFILQFLQRMNFDESKIRTFNTPDECDDLLSKGSENGGIAAAFDETPYAKLFLKKYCSKYTTVEPTYMTDGFAFVFPIGSPLVPDISRAVLNVTEGDKMLEIEKKWLEKQANCPNPSDLASTNSLGLESFWFPFFFIAFVSISALIVFLATFLHKHRDVFTCSDPETSWWEKFVELAKRFGIRKDEEQKANGVVGTNSVDAVEALSNASCPQSPSRMSLDTSLNTNGIPSQASSSNHTEINLVVHQDHQGSPHENAHGETAREIVPTIKLDSQTQDKQEPLEPGNVSH
ncbi:unnamed protein product [Ilex paraguariensis]|uniref:Ionotropic glutamate receptor C-terminal domain-containing protein n=1 Tax=Ilex paraguariensis TaxID=185542 RepID=A0ABC8RBI9_9AQUA